MEEGCLELPRVKVEKLLLMINNIVDNDFWVTARYLAKITGKIVSFSESLSSVCRFMTQGNCIWLFVSEDHGFSFETEQRIYCRIEFLEIELYEFTI